MLADKIHFDVIIIGGGPAGCTTAMKLAPAGLKIALVDKTTLPKAKVCGDALSGTVMKVLKGFPDNAFNEFMQIPGILPSWGIRFVAPNLETLDVPFVKDRNEQTPIPGVTCKRLDFERFMIRKISKYSNITLFPECNIKEIALSPSRELVTVSGDQVHLTAKVLVGADGLNSIVGRKLAGNKLNLRQFCLGVRGYYQGVTELRPENFIELHFIRDLLPNYLWVFPMQGGIANVGLGLMHHHIRKSHISPARKLEDILLSHPTLKDRFSHATLLGELESHGLLMGPDNKRISGTRFLLAGDAASLVDPFTGEGIGNAMVSGEIAAKIIQKAFGKNDFSETYFKEYDREIRKKFEKELKISKTLRKLASYPGLFNFVVKKADTSEKVRDLLCTMYTDLEVRKKLMNPLFYLTMLMEPLKRSSSYKP